MPKLPRITSRKLLQVLLRAGLLRSSPDGEPCQFAAQQQDTSARGRAAPLAIWRLRQSSPSSLSVRWRLNSLLPCSEN